MKKITAIIISIIIALSAFAIGYKMGAVDAMESAVINEMSDYHYSISYLDNQYECWYTK